VQALYARDTKACRKLSKIVLAVRYTAARKLQAVFFVAVGDGSELLEFGQEILAEGVLCRDAVSLGIKRHIGQFLQS
jgi:hypothetical protein